MSKSPAVIIAKNGLTPKLNEPIILSTGIKVLLKPVPSAAITKAQSMIKDPPVPRQEIEGKEGLFENPLDPVYLQNKNDTTMKRVDAQFDVMALLGVVLVDGVPDDNEWLPGLQLLSKLGHLDLADYNLDIPIEKEFIYKRYIAMSSADWIMLTTLSGLSAEDIAVEKDNFPGNQK